MPLPSAVATFVRDRWTPEQVDGIFSISRVEANARLGAECETPDEGRAWRGTVTDLESGDETVVRDLFSAGTHLVSPMVWSEVFARCEQPGVTVRWSDMRAVTAEGEETRPQRVRVNYQAHSAGGCDNTTVSVDELGLLQTTGVQRQVPQGAILPIPGA